MKEIGYCGNHCEHCFLLNVMAVKAIIQINKGYDYLRSFKDINDIDKILGIFEMEKY